MFIPLSTRFSTFWVVRRISKPTLANCHPNSDFDEFLEFFPILAVVVMVVRSGVLLLVMLLMVLLRLPRKLTIQHLAEICGKQLKRHFQCAADPITIRDRSDHVPRPFPSVRNPPNNTPDEHFVLENAIFRVQGIFPNFTKYCTYHAK